ncbi:UMP kinase [Ureaplasma miroungigenitalium]|uniref:Uridylate kinase n=1 Tax=Ureaplasma miroungigenitalium TaxID=1042321 RepID=A0ABT3BMB9_9BACT|nr:UMP kinase [Ureaplasma miroungigenitalium]MCV3728383.1 UMP kinase [Ureaplasma miroungigenitalium]MCV3734170.1 UMP kinase [Ureaplasma miroungigenitalium]
MQNKKHILIKISGAALKTNDESILDVNKINDLANQIKILKKDYVISIVVGGGNIWRGKIANDLAMDRSMADNMGMLATMINGLSIANVLKNHEVESVVLSSIDTPAFLTYASTNSINQAIKNDQVMIFVGGTGFPFFSTDSCAAIRAAQTNCQLILMGKNGVDGVYSADPKTNPDAIFYENLTYQEALHKNLQVMDQTALALCQENKIETIVFNIDKTDSIIDVLNNKTKYTLIK